LFVEITIDASNVLELMVASDKLGVKAVTTRCCSVIDQCPLDRVLEITSEASDIGLNNFAILESKVSRRVVWCQWWLRRTGRPPFPLSWKFLKYLQKWEAKTVQPLGLPPQTKLHA